MADAPQVAFDRTPIAYRDIEDQQDKFSTPIAPIAPPKQEAYAYYGEAQPPMQPPAFRGETILGLRKRNFWILVVAAVAIVAVAVGGSVGGVMAVQKSKYGSALQEKLQQLT